MTSAVPLFFVGRAPVLHSAGGLAARAVPPAVAPVGRSSTQAPPRVLVRVGQPPPPRACGPASGPVAGGPGQVVPPRQRPPEPGRRRVARTRSRSPRG